MPSIAFKRCFKCKATLWLVRPGRMLALIITTFIICVVKLLIKQTSTHNVLPALKAQTNTPHKVDAGLWVVIIFCGLLASKYVAKCIAVGLVAGIKQVVYSQVKV